MLKKILYSIVIAMIIFIAIGFFLPREVHVERSRIIDRSPATLYAVLNDYRQFSAWSPWAARDPDAEYRLSGPETGPGSRMSWEGDPRQVGSGWQEIVESRPYSLIRVSLYFDQQGPATSYFQLDPVQGGTRVTWGFDTDLLEGQGWMGGILARYFGLFFDTWIGTDYEQGLARLQQYAERLPAADFSDLDVDIVDVAPQDIFYVDSDTVLGSADITSSLVLAYREIAEYMVAHGIERAGQPMTITRAREGGRYVVEAAVPVLLPPSGLPALDAQAAPAGKSAGDREPGEAGPGEPSPDTATSSAAAEPVSRVRTGKAPSGRAVRAVHRGAHDRMGPTYEKLAAWMAVNGIEEGSVSWEQYISDPGETPDTDLITHIFFAIEAEQPE